MGLQVSGEETYIVKPSDVVDAGVSLEVADECDIIFLTHCNVVAIQARHPQPRHGNDCGDEKRRL